jgi:hypothetical protein
MACTAPGASLSPAVRHAWLQYAVRPACGGFWATDRVFQGGQGCMTAAHVRRYVSHVPIHPIICPIRELHIPRATRSTHCPAVEGMRTCWLGMHAHMMPEPSTPITAAHSTTTMSFCASWRGGKACGCWRPTGLPHPSQRPTIRVHTTPLTHSSFPYLLLQCPHTHLGAC